LDLLLMKFGVKVRNDLLQKFLGTPNQDLFDLPGSMVLSRFFLEPSVDLVYHLFRATVDNILLGTYLFFIGLL